MKKFKSLLLVAMLVALPVVSSAQNNAADAKQGTWSGFLTNRFADNWFIGVGGVAQLPNGPHDNLGSFGDRISFNPELTFGKWVMPTVGFRMQFNGGFNLNGFTNNSNHPYVVNKAGNSPYKKEWKQYNAHADALLNLSNWIGGYRYDRTWDFVAFAGIGFSHVWTPEVHNEFTANAGLINKIRITDGFGINLEYRCSMFDSKFTQEYHNLKAREASMHSVSLSLVFNINNIPFLRCAHMDPCKDYRWY